MPQCDPNTIVATISAVFFWTIFFWMCFHWANLNKHILFQHRIFYILRKNSLINFLVSKDLNRQVSKKK